MALIDVEHLHKRYGEKIAVDDVSLAVEEGEIFGILGRNGAGKTTTVECIVGLRRPDRGRIRVLGMDPQRGGPGLREQVGVQLQESALQDKLKQTQQKLRELTGNDPANPAALSPEQTQTIDEFRAEMVATRQQLRAVQAALRQDIEWLKAILEFCDIALVPILVAIAAVVLGGLRLRRRRRRQAQPALA